MICKDIVELNLQMFSVQALLERNRLLDADLGVTGGGRIWLLAMLVRKVEK